MIAHAEYAFYWSFYQDGSIKYEIKLTGELSTNQLSPGEREPGWGSLVADRVNSQHHQHMFCARLDMACDDADGGKGLQISQVRRSCTTSSAVSLYLVPMPLLWLAAQC